MKIEKISIDKLLLDPANARKHGKKNLDSIKGSLAKFGQQKPIVVNADNVIVAGNGTLQAAKELGWKEIDIVRTNLKGSDITAFGIADNRTSELAEWDDDVLKELLDGLKAEDFDLSAIGFDDDELAELMGGKSKEGLTDADDVPEVPEEPKTKLGDIYRLGNHRLMCGDSTDAGSVALLMDGKKADMVFTDPPYGVSYADKNKFLNAQDKGNHCQTEIKNDHMTIDETGNFVFNAFCRIKENLADRSSYYITAPQGGDLLMMMMMMMQKACLPLRHCLIWVKNNHVLGRTDYNYKHEPILFGWNKVHDFYGEGEHKFSTWEIAKPNKNDLHPTMKPVALIENAALNSTRAGNLILDVFGGSGSTLIACEKTNRNCYMMELDEKYCDVIIKRWEDFTGKKAELLSS